MGFGVIAASGAVGLRETAASAPIALLAVAALGFVFHGQIADAIAALAHTGQRFGVADGSDAACPSASSRR